MWSLFSDEQNGWLGKCPTVRCYSSIIIGMWSSWTFRLSIVTDYYFSFLADVLYANVTVVSRGFHLNRKLFIVECGNKIGYYKWDMSFRN